MEKSELGTIWRLHDGQADLLYASSLDGYIADDGNFDWSAPSEEAFAFITDLYRPIGTYLLSLWTRGVRNDGGLGRQRWRFAS
jgi:hypothetical protein